MRYCRRPLLHASLWQGTGKVPLVRALLSHPRQFQWYFRLFHGPNTLDGRSTLETEIRLQTVYLLVPIVFTGYAEKVHRNVQTMILSAVPHYS